MKQKKTIRCPYCGGTAILRDASFVYGDRSYGGKVYVCSHYPACDALFDQIWQRGILSRADAYRWMADKFCLSDAQAHIGQFGSYMCDQVILESRKLLANQCLQAAG